jgi:hypothetical protein
MTVSFSRKTLFRRGGLYPLLDEAEIETYEISENMEFIIVA